MRTYQAAVLLALAPAIGCGDNLAGGVDGATADAPPPPADAPSAPPGLRLYDFPIAVDVTPDGRTAVFEAFTATEVVAHLVDTLTGTDTPGGVVGDPSRDLATAIAATGRMTAMHGVPVEAGVWTAAGGWTDLGSPHPAGCDQDIGAAWDISADGHVVVGMVWDGCAPDAFLWSDADGAGAFTPLARLGAAAPGSPSGPTNRATVISDDGSVIAGFAQNDPLDRSPAVWSADGTGFLIDPTQLDTPGEILSISAAGDVLGGIWGYDGFVWTSAGGSVPLPRLDSSLPTDPVYPNAIAADGHVVLGAIGDAFFSTPIAFVWTAAAGTRALADVATAAGVTLPAGLILNNVLGASADGTVLIGTATDADQNLVSFVLRVPATAYDAP
jgi:hypothetical protein